MRTFTVVTRKTNDPLPAELALLEAPVSTEEPSAPGEYVGRGAGVMLDERNRVIAFVVRLEPKLAGSKAPWTLLPANAMVVTDQGVLASSWTEDQLMAQPRIDARFQPHELVTGGLPVESQWMPARPNPVPPGPEVNKSEAMVEGAAGGAIGAAVGVAAGLLAAGPIGALGLGVFFAAGGSLAGLLSGGSHETAVQAAELEMDTVRSETPMTESEDADTRARLAQLTGAIAKAGDRLVRHDFELVSSDETTQRMAS
jgi:hypothetical protein